MKKVCETDTIPVVLKDKIPIVSEGSFILANHVLNII